MEEEEEERLCAMCNYFSNILDIVTFGSKYTRALSFQKFWQALAWQGHEHISFEQKKIKLLTQKKQFSGSRMARARAHILWT